MEEALRTDKGRMELSNPSEWLPSPVAPSGDSMLAGVGGRFCPWSAVLSGPPPKGPSLLLFAASKPRADLPRGDPQLQRVNKHGDVLRREEATLGRGYKHQ